MKRSRTSLKDFFKNGNRPSQQEFEDLIDSSLNIQDDGFTQTQENGLILTPRKENNILLSFCNRIEKAPSWQMSVNEQNDLSIQSITDDGNTVRIGNKNYRRRFSVSASVTNIYGDLEVNGIIKGRSVASKLAAEIVTDGKWHPVTKDMYGICALQIVAVVQGAEHSGEYAVLVAWASHAFGCNRNIRTLGAHYGFWGHKLKLRWHRLSNGSCRLEIKSRLKYKSENKIDCRISYLYHYERPLSSQA